MTTKKSIYDASGNIIRTLETQEDGTHIFRIREDLTAQIELNKFHRDNLDRKSHWRPAAHMPVTDADRAIREGWIHDKRAMRRWMNDPDNRDHRIWEGRV